MTDHDSCEVLVVDASFSPERAVALPHTLTALTLNLQECTATTVQGLRHSLSFLQQLCKITFEFRSYEFLGKVSQVREVLGSLEEVTLRCNDFRHLESMDGVDSTLVQLNPIRTLVVEQRNCTNLVEVDRLGKHLHCLNGLTTLMLDFSGCGCLASIDTLGAGLTCLSRLYVLRLGLRDCRSLERFEGLFQGMGHLKGIHRLELDMANCEGLTGTAVDELGRALGRFHGLTCFSLTLAGCCRLTQLDELANGLGPLRALRGGSFFMDLQSLPYVNPSLARTFGSLADFLEENRVALAASVAQATVVEIIGGVRAFDGACSTTMAGSSGLLESSSITCLSDSWQQTDFIEHGVFGHDR